MGLLIAALFLWLMSTMDLIDNNTPYTDVVLYLLAGILFFAFIGVFILLLAVVFQSIPAFYKWALACFISVVYYFFIPQFTTFGIILITFWSIVSFSLLGAAIWVLISKIKSKRKIDTPYKTLSYLFLGLIAAFPLGSWLFINHSSFKPISIPQHPPTSTISLQNPSLPGKYTYKRLSYGSGKDLHRLEYGKEAALTTKSVDGSDFVKEWGGITGWLRSRYWGFDTANMPLNGLVWYPEGQGPFPLVLIVHGNHEMSAASDNGYAYLGTLLASRGFITVSIDENFLNGAWHSDLNESPARAWLVLEHLKQWRSWNKDKGNPFHRKVDMNRIALIGHSRGGEAIAAAAALNHLSHYPGDGNILFNYGFNIRALVAIAPVDAQFKPGGVKIELDNIDYLILQGSHDGDVRTFEGSAQFHRINFTDTSYHFKAALYILGANHGQFNSLWGTNDTSPPNTALFDLGQIMPAEQQQQIAKVYTSAFLETTLNKEIDYLPLFQNYRTGEQWLPRTLYFSEFADSTYQYVDSDDKDIDLAKTSLAGGIEKGENLKIWRQGQVTLKDGGSLHIGTYLGWDTSASDKDPPSFLVNLPEKGLKLSASNILVLDLANGNDVDSEDSSKHPTKTTSELSNQLVDFSIEITDKLGNSAILPLSEYSYLPPPLDVRLMKASLLDPITDSEYVFQTYEFPLSEFMKQNAYLNPSALKSIKLIFDKTSEGLIILDNIAFRNKEIAM